MFLKDLAGTTKVQLSHKYNLVISSQFLMCQEFAYNHPQQCTQHTILTGKLTYMSTNVTGFVKRGLPHTSNLPTLKSHNFRLVKVIDLKLDQQHSLITGEGFGFVCF